jgi:hypothetical protein
VPDVLRIFVKRGALWRFHRLTRDSEPFPVSVEWDRRIENRRAAVTPVPDDHRRKDRRGAAPFTWEAAQFVVVDDRAALVEGAGSH